jgi:hypothetical protein
VTPSRMMAEAFWAAHESLSTLVNGALGLSQGQTSYGAVTSDVCLLTITAIAMSVSVISTAVRVSGLQ